MGSVRSVRWWVGCVAVATALAAPAVLFVLPASVAGAVVAEQQPTEQQVADARERATQLRAGERRQAEDVASATAALDVAAADSALALEAYRAAAEARQQAMSDLARREAAFGAAEAGVARARAELVRWARGAYVEGGAISTSPGLYALLSGGSTDDVATHRAWLRRVGNDRAEVVSELEGAFVTRLRVAGEAQRAAELAVAAAARAAAARDARDAVLAEQRRRLVDLRLALAGTRRAVAAVERSVADLTAARLSAGVYPGADGGGGNRVTGPVGDCVGGEVSRYGNGRIPLSALCPLAVPSGGWLRADAAYAFNRLSGAFAARFGRALCVTDSYRSYDEQARVHRELPGLAAVPGRSNHGWGTAADLCGGVERFDAPEHAWMRLNATLFGWFHPAWAQQGGTLPEPWHWEFAG